MVARASGIFPSIIWFRANNQEAVVGSFVGVFFGPLGLLGGPFVGALVGELIHVRELRQATRVGLGTWIGVVVGTVLKLGLAFGMLGLFAFAWFF